MLTDQGPRQAHDNAGRHAALSTIYLSWEVYYDLFPTIHKILHLLSHSFFKQTMRKVPDSWANVKKRQIILVG